MKEKTPIALFNRQIFLKFPVSARHWARHWGQVMTNDEDPVLTEFPFSYGRPDEQIDKWLIKCWVAIVLLRNRRSKGMDGSEG